MQCEPFNYRAPGVLPPSADDDQSPAVDEFIRIIPLVPAQADRGDSFQCPALAYQLRASPNGGLQISSSKFKTFREPVPLIGSGVSGTLGNLRPARVRIAKVELIKKLSHSLFRQVDAGVWPGLLGYLSKNQTALFDETKGIRGSLFELEHLCCPSDGDFGSRPDVFVLGQRARQALLTELENASIAADFRFSGLTQRTTLHHLGIPVLLGDVPDSDAWALKISGVSAIRIMFKEAGDLWGIDTKEIEDGLEVTADYALLVPEPRSIARVTGLFGTKLPIIGQSAERTDMKGDICTTDVTLAQNPTLIGNLIPTLAGDGTPGLLRFDDESERDLDPEHPDAKTVERIRKLIEELEKEKKRKHLSREQIIELMKKLAKEDSSSGAWARKWLDAWDKAEQETTGQKRAGEAGLKEEPGRHDVLEPEELAAGKKAHREAETRPGEHDEYVTPSGGRIDRYDPEKGRIREIKPNTPEEKKKGIEQLKRYKEEMDKKTGKNHIMELTTYDVDENGNYVWHDFIVEPDGSLRIVDRPKEVKPGSTGEEGDKAAAERQAEEERREKEKKEREEHERTEREKAAHEPRHVP